MALQAIIFLLLGAAFLVLILINAFLFWHAFKANKKIDILLEKGNIKDLKDVLFNQIERTKKQDLELKEVFNRIQKIEGINEKTFQKSGVVRFNPFSEIGGNQSFAIDLLDDKNNGFVLSSLFIKEGNRVYAKQIKNGKSDHLLSNEEKEAIARAIAENFK